jgi:hypothetical protein
MVWILADDHDLKLVEGALVEGTKYVGSCGIDHARGILMLNKLYQLIEIGFCELLLEHLFPILCYAYICHTVVGVR